jgi:AcrR family transcriptional regulator
MTLNEEFPVCKILLERRAAVPRSDARENRAAILEAARLALDESGEISLNAVAKAAGVANATLYRHFPTREALVLGVYRGVVDDVAAAAPSLLLTLEPSAALRAWIDRVAEYAIAKRGFASAVQALSRDDGDLYDETYRAIVGALDLLLRATEQTGAIRPGLSADDVILAFAGLWQLSADDAWQAQVDALYDIVLHGLAPR